MIPYLKLPRLAFCPSPMLKDFGPGPYRRQLCAQCAGATHTHTQMCQPQAAGSRQKKKKKQQEQQRRKKRTSLLVNCLTLARKIALLASRSHALTSAVMPENGKM